MIFPVSCTAWESSRPRDESPIVDQSWDLYQLKVARNEKSPDENSLPKSELEAFLRIEQNPDEDLGGIRDPERSLKVSWGNEQDPDETQNGVLCGNWNKDQEMRVKYGVRKWKLDLFFEEFGKMLGTQTWKERDVDEG